VVRGIAGRTVGFDVGGDLIKQSYSPRNGGSNELFHVAVEQVIGRG
jgi:hypothetical protein